MNRSKRSNVPAFSLIEILLAMTLFAIFSMGIFYVSLDTIQTDSRIQLDNEALLYAQEGLEAIRNIRDRDYLALTNGDHGLSFDGTEWVFIAAPEDIYGFYSRTVTISDVYRDVDGEIAETGTFDPETKKVVSEVSWDWKSIIPRSISLTTYLSNWTGDDWIQTTCTEFNAGTFDGTIAEITVAPPTDNCALQLELVEEPSTFFTSADLGEHGTDVIVDGNYAYVATDLTNTGLTIVDISNPESPSIVKQLDINGKGRFLTKDGNYVYVGIQNNSKGLAIVDVTTPGSASFVTNLDVGDYGNQPVVSGNTLYMGTEKDDHEFVVVNITNKNSPTVSATLNLEDGVPTVHLSGSYVFAGSDDDRYGLQVVDISTPGSPQKVATLDVGEEVNTIEISGSIAFLGTEDDDDSLQVVNISDPLHPWLILSLDVGGEIQDLVASGNYLYAALDATNTGLAVLNISNPLSLELLYTRDIQGKGTGIASDTDYVYVTLDVNNRGLVILGAQEAEISTSGNYISSVLDTGGEDTRYNFIEWDHTEAPGGYVRFQIRTANTETNLVSATWVGSDGTSGTYYENPRTAIVLEPSRSGQHYFQFRVEIGSDGVTTPTIENIRINYNP